MTMVPLALAFLAVSTAAPPSVKPPLGVPPPFASHAGARARARVTVRILSPAMFGPGRRAIAIPGSRQRSATIRDASGAPVRAQLLEFE